MFIFHVKNNFYTDRRNYNCKLEDYNMEESLKLI